MTEQEFEHVVPRLRPLIRRVGLDFFSSADDAEDVCQESLIRLWTYCEQLDARRNLDALAVKVAKNVCVSIYRSSKQHQPLTDIHPSPNADEADAPLRQKEANEKIDASLARLAPRERDLIRRRYMDDQTVDEIAHDTGIAKPSVKSILSMAKKKFFHDYKKRE